MGLDRPGITPTAPQIRRRPRVRAKPSANSGGVAGAVAAATRPATQKRTSRSSSSNLAQQVNVARAQVRKGRGPKADTGNVLKGRPVIKVDTGNILHGRKVPPPAALISGRPSQSGIIPGEGSLKGALKGLKNFGSDILHLPQTVVQGGYETAAAAAEAISGSITPRPYGGSTTRAKRLIKGVTEHDPFYLLADSFVKRREGDSAGADRASARALDEFAAHPGLAALELYGAKGSVGKGITRVQRRVTGTNPTVRAPAKYPNSAVANSRKYTDDAIQRKFDRQRERRKISKARQMRNTAQRLETVNPVANAGRIVELRAKANSADPRVMTDKAVKVRAARSAAAARALTERNQAAVAKATRKAIKPGRKAAKPTAAYTLAAQALVDGTPTQLTAFRDKLAAVHDGLSASEQQANRQLRSQIQKAIDANHQPANVQAAANRFKTVIEPLQNELVKADVLPKARANKAPLVPYAVTRMKDVVPGPKGPMRPATAADFAAKPHVVARRQVKALDAALVKATEAHAKARAAYANAKGRAEILSRNVSGPVAERRAAGDTVKSGTGAQYAGGGLGVRQAAQQLQKATKDRNTLATLAADARKTRAAADKAWKAGAVKRRQASAGTRGMVKVTAAEIKAHMAAHGVAEPTYVSQRPPRSAGIGSGGRLARPSVPGATRTGRSTITGFDASPKVLVDTARNTQRLVDMVKSYDSHINEFAHAPSRGKWTRKRAAQLAAELEARSGSKYVAVPDNPFAGDRTLARTIDDAGGPDSPNVAKAVSDVLAAAYEGRADVSGPYSIIPKAAADELKAQAMVTVPRGPIAATLKGVSSSFRRTVLATSPSWFAGNAIEGVMRAAISGVRPSDKKLFEHALAEIAKTDPRLADELRSRVAGGGHYTSADRQSRGGVLHQYEASAMQPVAQALERFWAKPGPEGAANVWGKWTHLVFNQLSGRMESGIQSSMAGAALRRGHLIDAKTAHHVIKLSDTAVQQAAKGLLNTNEQAALGEAVARMYGRYDGFTADSRHHIATYTPFAAWTFNAINFVLHVLPADHPTAVMLATLQERATRDIRKDAKLDDLPNWLKGSIPLSNGRKLRLVRYTPFGAFTDIKSTLGGAVLPQFSGVTAALRGEDWKGKKLYGPDGKPLDDAHLALLAAQAFGEATVPLFSVIKRVAQKGPSALNPLKPIGPPPAKPRAATSNSSNAPVGASGIDFSTYTGGGASGIDFSGYGANP